MAITYHRPRRINWRPYLTRRVILVTIMSLVGYAIDYYTRYHLAGKGGELLIGAVLGHCLLEVEG